MPVPNYDEETIGVIYGGLLDVATETIDLSQQQYLNAWNLYRLDQSVEAMQLFLSMTQDDNTTSIWTDEDLTQIEEALQIGLAVQAQHVGERRSSRTIPPEKTPDEIEAEYQRGEDAANTIIRISNKPEMTDTDRQLLYNNLRHLILMKDLKKENDPTVSIWTDQDFSDIDDAIELANSLLGG